MMSRFLFIILLFPLFAFGQRPAIYKIPADSVKFITIDNTGSEFVLESDTKDSTYGVLTNIVNGRTQFKKLRLQQLTDTTFRLLLGTNVQGQVITIPSVVASGVTYTLTKNAGLDSIILTGSNGSRYSVKDSTGTIHYASNGLSLDGDTVELGGTLTGNVTIDGATNKKSFTLNTSSYSSTIFDTVGIATGRYTLTQNGKHTLDFLHKVAVTNIGALAVGSGGMSISASTTRGGKGLYLYGSSAFASAVSGYGLKIEGSSSGNATPDIVISPSNQKFAISSVPRVTSTDSIYVQKDNWVSTISVADLTSGISGQVYVDTIYKNAGGDSIVWEKNSIRYALLDKDNQTISFYSGGKDSVGFQISGGNQLPVGRPPLDSVNLSRSADSIVLNSFRSNGQIMRSAIKDSTGGTGTVTSISQGNGITNSTNPITTTGTISVDTSVIASKTYSDAKDAQWSVSRTSDSANFVFTNGSTVTQISDNGYVLLSTTVASGASSVDFTGLNSTYYTYMVIVDSYTSSSAGPDLSIRIGTGGTPTYQTGNVYDYHVWYTVNSATAVAAATGSNATAIVLSGAFGAGTTPLSGRFFFYNPSQSTYYHLMDGTYEFLQNGNALITEHFAASYEATTAVTAVRFYPSSGTCSGTFKLYGLK